MARLLGKVACRLVLLACMGGALLAGGATARESGDRRVLEGVVTRVSDGDTLWLRPSDGRRPLKVRVLGIDAPERCQAWGAQATERMKALVLYRRVRVEGDGFDDDHGRRLARVIVDGEDVGQRLVREGHAWSYRFRRDPGPYAPQEAEARKAGRGLHADATAMHPRDFRRTHRCD